MQIVNPKYEVHQLLQVQTPGIYTRYVLNPTTIGKKEKRARETSQPSSETWHKLRGRWQNEADSREREREIQSLRRRCQGRRKDKDAEKAREREREYKGGAPGSFVRRQRGFACL